MTTIAYKDDIIAYDSRSTADNEIRSDNFNKMQVMNGVRFFMSGAVSDFELIMSAYFDPSNKPLLNMAALVVDDGQALLFSCNEEDGYWKMPLNHYTEYAIGSGSQHALTAMDLGCSAVEAVKMAAKRDAATGGRVRKFSVKK